MNKKNILLLSLVHPDFLPPVYAVAQSLRDLEYNIHILTFDSFVPTQYVLGENVELESVGSHYNSGTFERIKLRNAFKKRARQLINEYTAGIITFCPFSFYCGLKIKNNVPIIYHALEVADFKLSSFLRSPLSNYRNLLALNNLPKADLVATPSIQRSAWLAGRCHLSFMPYTILNTAYLPKKVENNSYELFKELVPAEFLNKKIILYTGAVNTDTCIMELIQAFDLIDDAQSVLIVNGLKDNEYCNEITEYVQKCKTRNRIKLLPYLTRDKVIALQSSAHIGVNLTREYQDNAKSKMPAPNKVGEYLAQKLYIIGILNEYLRPYKLMGIAALADTTSPQSISIAIREALNAVNDESYKFKIQEFVKDYFSMQQQIIPIVDFINNSHKL